MKRLPILNDEKSFLTYLSLQISKISYIDGDKGILEYRGYPIEQLAEKSTFLETAFLVIFGELPTAQQLKKFSKK